MMGLAQTAVEQEQLRQALARQLHELRTIVQQLERHRYLVPPVDNVQWQGPARGAYEMLVDRLRSTLQQSLVALRAAERSTEVAVTTLSDRVR